MSEYKNLPFGSEFSPSQIDLPQLLKLCEKNNGNVKSLENEIKNIYFLNHGNGNIKNQLTLAMNCRLGLKAYGIIDEDARLTDVGIFLSEIKDDEQKLYSELARHILLNLNGMTFVQCLRDMEISGEAINLTTLRDSLRERGLHYPSGGKHPSMMRLWLAKAGVIIGSRWQVDDNRIKELLGISYNDVLEVLNLSQLQRVFLRTLANIDTTVGIPANEIVKLAETTFGIKFPEKSLPKEVLHSLVDSGYITIEKTTSGRGAKPFIVTPTEKFNVDILTPILKQIENQTDPKLVELLRKPLTVILDELHSDNRYISGLALEALAFKLMRLIDMDYIATRLRAQSTGGAEVDLIFESVRLIYSRWQIQCKNTDRVSLDDVAKEVGLTHFLKSNAIVIVSTGTIGSEARKYANKIMQDTNLCIVMVDRNDINIIKNSPSSIIDIFNREAKLAMNIKKLDI